MPVILTIQQNSQELRAVIAELGLRLRRPYILIGPTNHHLDAHCHELLAHAGAAYFPLEHTVIVSTNGNLHAAKTPGDLFIKFNPDPESENNEDMPRQVFGVVKALECEQPCKWPTVFAVFSMYCKEELSAGQFARKCHCSNATIISRLKLLRLRLGCHPARLRRYSAHFERMEESLSDPRARRLYRKGAIYGQEESVAPVE